MTRNEVVTWLRTAVAHGKPVTLARLWKTDRRVHQGVVKHFNTIGEAMRTAARGGGSARKWSRAAVTAELKRLGRDRKLSITKRGLPRAGHVGVAYAAERYFGSVPQARRITGVPNRSRPYVDKVERWDEDRVVHEIRSRQREGLPLAGDQVPAKLRSAAQRHCGSWQNAIEIAGLDYDAVRGKRAAWSKQEVLEALQAFARARQRGDGPPLSQMLQLLARQHFGSTRNAFAEAGIDGKPVRYRRRVLAELEIEKELRRLAREYPNMPLSDLRAKKVAADAVRRYGDLATALERANIQHWPRQHTSPDKVIEDLRSRHARGDALNTRDIRRDEPRLYGAAIRRFGSMKKAILAAGLPVPGPLPSRR